MIGLREVTAAPGWIQLLPAGPDVIGRDGRAWRLSDPAAIVAAFQRRGIPLPVDWEHATEHRAPSGLEAPAAGWVSALDVRQGAIWGNVEWTDRAAAQIRAREYRYLSPVFQFEKSTGEIRALVSAGLTNSPNLRMVALNQDESNLNELRRQFFASPGLVKEFGGEFDGYVAYCRAESAGRVHLSRQMQLLMPVACNSESDFLQSPELIREFGEYKNLIEFNRALATGRAR